VVGIAHYLYHRSTTRIESVCYLQDLFTSPATRRSGVARALIESVRQDSTAAGVRRLYWQTHQDNTAARSLYDQMAHHHGFIVYAA
jgi:ribosomal protein S18 acetylase RimI-like enzyme